jgi:hypothetical protein
MQAAGHAHGRQGAASIYTKGAIMPSSEITDYDIIDEMERTGGGYVKALAGAYRRADDDNRRLLQPAFDKYRDEYAQRAAERRRSKQQG